MTQDNHAIRLTGLDAQDPLAYLASLGCLLAVSDRCRRAGLAAPAMYFERAGVPTPLLCGPFPDEEALLDMLVADLEAVAGRDGSPRDRFLTFHYDDEGSPVRDLKPPLGEFRRFAQSLIEESSPDDRRTIDWAAATLTDVAVDRSKGNAKPFALHFLAGKQRFLTSALELLDGVESKLASQGVDREDLRAAVLGPWPNDRTLKVFRWSPLQDRAYALRASAPADDPIGSTPGAEWLALRGLGLLSSAPVGTKIETSGVHGRWKTATFSYPIWPASLDEDAVRALLRHPALQPLGAAGPWTNVHTLPRGVEVLTCRIFRPDRYGAFSRPSRR